MRRLTGGKPKQKGDHTLVSHSTFPSSPPPPPPPSWHAIPGGETPRPKLGVRQGFTWSTYRGSSRKTRGNQVPGVECPHVLLNPLLLCPFSCSSPRPSPFRGHRGHIGASLPPFLRYSTVSSSSPVKLPTSDTDRGPKGKGRIEPKTVTPGGSRRAVPTSPSGDLAR